MEQLLNTKQAADFLGITSEALSNWALGGIGPNYIKLENHLRRYRVSDLDRWLDTHTVNPRDRSTPARQSLKWKGLSDAQWAKITAAFKRTDSGRRCLGRSVRGARAWIDDILQAACNGEWPSERPENGTAAERSFAKALPIMARQYEKTRLWGLIFWALKDDPDFPFSLGTQVFIVTDARRGSYRRFLTIDVQVSGDRHSADGLRRSLNHLQRSRARLQYGRKKLPASCGPAG
jgi:hypothetical protein